MEKKVDVHFLSFFFSFLGTSSIKKNNFHFYILFLIKIDITLDDQVLCGDLQKAIQDFDEHLDNTNLSIKKAMQKNSQELATKANQVVADLQVLENYLQGGLYISKDTEPEKAMSELNKVKHKLEGD